MKEIKHFKTGFPVLLLLIGLAVISCASYEHFQSIKNDTNNHITRVYIRDTGNKDWGSIRKGIAWTENGAVISNQYSIASWNEETIPNGRQVIFFQERGKSATPRTITNKDIRIIDNNGISYTKINVSIKFSTVKTTQVLVFAGTSKIATSDPITFTARDRDPLITVQNNTGYLVRTDSGQTINNGSNSRMQVSNDGNQRNFIFNYFINNYSFSKEFDGNSDSTVIITERPPTLTITNNTGYNATIIRPFDSAISNGGNYVHVKQSRDINPLHTITYNIGNAQYDEQVTLNDVDITLSLTKRPSTVTIINNVGTTINMIWFRIPGAPQWLGGNINIREGTVRVGGQAQTGDLTGSIVNRDSMRIWMGNVLLRGDTFDIRITDVNNVDYVKSNVRITSDMNLTFTQSDRR